MNIFLTLVYPRLESLFSKIAKKGGNWASSFYSNTLLVAAEVVFTSQWTILTKLSIFVETRDVCGSVDFSDEENRIQAIRGRAGLRSKVGFKKVLLYISDLYILSFLCCFKSRVFTFVLPFIEASLESPSRDALATRVFSSGNICSDFIRSSDGKITNIAATLPFSRIFIHSFSGWFVFSDPSLGLWWRGISRPLRVIRWEDARRTRMFVHRRSEGAAGETPPALTRWPSADFASRLGVAVLSFRTWKMRRLSRSWACLTAWCRGSPPGPWCSAGWCPTSPSTGTSAGPRTQRGSPPTCAWSCWWPTSCGSSLGRRRLL